MGRAKVTFFMIAYNEEKLVRRAVQSVLDQTEPEVELHVRNNGSTDRTGEILREMAARDGRVHVVENEANWWKDAQRSIPFVNGNGAVDIWPVDQETLGDYVSFLDADDCLEPTFAGELLRAAQKEQAEITVCGSIFQQDGAVEIGRRLPPALSLRKRAKWGPALRNAGTFAQLYGSFRTYWGKLFQRDFFLRHYDEAWQPIGGRYGAFLDTVTMLRYLRRCERLCCTVKPLYRFTASQSSSTYSNPPPTAGLSKALMAEALFEEGMVFLREVGADTIPNCQFLYQLNWTFCWEAMEGLQRTRGRIVPQDVDRIVALLNNKVAHVYLAASGAEIWGQLEPILQNVWRQSGEKLALYLRYPMRLMYIYKLADACPDSGLLPLLILGVLCDPENGNLLGENLLHTIAPSFEGLKKSVERGRFMEWAKRHNLLDNWWVDEIQQFDGEDGTAQLLAQQLQAQLAREELEAACETLAQLSRKSPLHRDGIYCRIQMAEVAGEHELAVVLAASARVLFGLDAEMQSLCWLVLSQEGAAQ